MADKDLEGDGPSLELPSLRFGRKKKAKEPASPEPVAPVEDAVPAHPVVEPEPAPSPAPSPAPAPAPIPAPAPAPVVAAPVVAAPAPVPPRPVIEDLPEPEPEANRPTREFALPAIPALQAAVAVGAVIGLLAVLLTFASLKLCEVVRGTDSCGGPGLLLLVATLVVLTYVGGWLLRAFGSGDPGSTSFLAVGLHRRAAMLFLLDVIYNWWMVIVIPIVAMAAYALSWWVTTRLVDLDD